jgi:hypothetical protein
MAVEMPFMMSHEALDIAEQLDNKASVQIAHQD